MDSLLEEGREFNIEEAEEISKLLNNEITTDQIKQLRDLSIESKDTSYSPYSKFRVGCALLTEDGKIFTGNDKIF
jgi:hypothetical protein